MTSNDETLVGEGWEGNADDLATAAGRILAARGIDEDPPNERLVRDYVQRGIISPLEQRGIYGRRHLLEMVAARVLVKDGWPLAKIAEHFPNSSDQELLALIPDAVNPALAVTRRLRFERRTGPSAQESGLSEPPRPRAYASGQPASPAPRNFNLRAARGTRLQAELRNSLRRLGLDPDAPAVEHLTLIAIAPWCQLLVESDRLQHVTADEAEEVGRAVTARLLDPAIRKGGK